MPDSFFDSLVDPKASESFTKKFDNNVHNYIELRNSSWLEVMMMPYNFFIKDLQWKIELEETKRQKAEEAKRASSNKAYEHLQRKNRPRK